jgi:hypothetical protein
MTSADAMQLCDPRDADAVARLLHRWRADRPAMGVLALVPEAETGAVPGLQRLCRDAGVPLIGAIFPALIVEEEFRARGAWLLRFDEMPYAALHVNLPAATEELGAAAERIVTGVRERLGGERDVSLLLLFDALVPKIGSLLDEIYLRLANRVHYFGASAGSESFKPVPCLFDAERVVSNAVLVVLLKRHRGAVLEHGYTAPAKMITATSADGNRVVEIDWRPAIEVYRELVREHYGVEIDRENFYQYAVHFPFAIVRANGMILVRIPVALEADGSFFCVDEVPAHSLLTLMPEPEVDSARTIEALADGLRAHGDTIAGSELMLFYCAGRRLQLGLDAAAELRDFQRQTGARRVVGVLTLGEIGCPAEGSYPLLHNATLVATRWPEGLR